MIKTFDTIREARKRFEELRLKPLGFGTNDEKKFVREIFNNADYFYAVFQLCKNEIRLHICDCNISSIATLDKIKQLFDEVGK